MPSIRMILKEAEDILKKTQIPSCQLDAELILAHVLQQDRTYLYTNLDLEISNAVYKQCMNLVEKRSKKMPIAYIRGFKEFWSRRFIVNESVLIPRPETEMLIERSLEITKEKKQLSIFDIGTGSGNIAITLAKELPDAKVTTVDISSEALLVAKKNALLHGVTNRINFVCGNLFDPIPETSSFDLIVSNPPYVPTHDIAIPELAYEPREALDGKSEGLFFIKKIIDEMPRFIKKDGVVLIEIGYKQIDALQTYIEHTQFKLTSFKDGNGVIRLIELRNII